MIQDNHQMTVGQVEVQQVNIKCHQDFENHFKKLIQELEEKDKLFHQKQLQISSPEKQEIFQNKFLKEKENWLLNQLKQILAENELEVNSYYNQISGQKVALEGKLYDQKNCIKSENLEKGRKDLKGKQELVFLFKKKKIENIEDNQISEDEDQESDGKDNQTNESKEVVQMSHNSKEVVQISHYSKDLETWEEVISPSQANGGQDQSQAQGQLSSALKEAYFWPKDLHDEFMRCFVVWGKTWKMVAQQMFDRGITTKDQLQCRTHGQKYLLSLEEIVKSLRISLRATPAKTDKPKHEYQEFAQNQVIFLVEKKIISKINKYEEDKRLLVQAYLNDLMLDKAIDYQSRFQAPRQLLFQNYTAESQFLRSIPQYIRQEALKLFHAQQKKDDQFTDPINQEKFNLFLMNSLDAPQFIKSEIDNYWQQIKSSQEPRLRDKLGQVVVAIEEELQLYELLKNLKVEKNKIKRMNPRFRDEYPYPKDFHFLTLPKNLSDEKVDEYSSSNKRRRIFDDLQSKKIKKY